MCSSRKYTYPPNRGSMEIPRGRGAAKEKVFKEKHGAKSECPNGWWGCKPKNPLCGGCGYFLEPHNRLVLPLSPHSWDNLSEKHGGKGRHRSLLWEEGRSRWNTSLEQELYCTCNQNVFKFTTLKCLAVQGRLGLLLHAWLPCLSLILGLRRAARELFFSVMFTTALQNGNNVSTNSPQSLNQRYRPRRNSAVFAS